MQRSEQNEVDVLDTLAHLRNNGFGPLLDILSNPAVFLRNGRVNLSAIERAAGWKSQHVKAEMARARDLFGEMLPFGRRRRSARAMFVT
jgi:hypothetical protein